jgi:hypothetical protein
MRKWMMVSVAVVACLGIAACGGGDKKLSKADLAKKADKICADSASKSGKITQPADLTADPVAAAAYFEKVLPVAENQTNKFEDLKPNDDAKAEWNQLVARQKQGEDTLKTILAKAKAKDRSGLQDLAKLQRIDKKFRAEATAIGATGCAS